MPINGPTCSAGSSLEADPVVGLIKWPTKVQNLVGPEQHQTFAGSVYDPDAGPFEGANARVLLILGLGAAAFDDKRLRGKGDYG